MRETETMEDHLKKNFDRTAILYPVDALTQDSLTRVGYTDPVVDDINPTILPSQTRSCPCYASQRRPLCHPRSILPLIGPARHMRPWKSHENCTDGWKSERRWWIYLVNSEWEREHVDSKNECWYCGNPSTKCSVDFGQTFCTELALNHQICRHQSAVVKRSGKGTYTVWTYWNTGTFLLVFAAILVTL